MLPNSPETMANYKRAASKMQISTLIVYCEGSDAEFYKKIFLHYQIRADVSNPPGLRKSDSGCTKVVQKVRECQNSRFHTVGIIDGDFKNLSKEQNILRLNYYSLENILVNMSPLFTGLSSAASKYYSLNDNQFKKPDILKIRKYTYSKSRKRINQIEKYFDPKFHEYIENNINTHISFKKLMDLKEPVERFSSMRLAQTNKSKGRYLRTFLNYRESMSADEKKCAKNIADVIYESRILSYKNYKLLPIEFLNLPEDLSELFEFEDRTKVNEIKLNYKK